MGTTRLTLEQFQPPQRVRETDEAYGQVMDWRQRGWVRLIRGSWGGVWAQCTRAGLAQADKERAV